MFRTVTLFADANPSWSCSQAVSKPVWHIPLLCVQWKTPDDGQRNCPKHVEFYSKNKFEELVYLVGFRPDPARKLSANLYDIYHRCVYSEKLLMMERGNCLKHVEFYSKNKFEKLVHVIGFVIRIFETFCVMFSYHCVINIQFKELLRSSRNRHLIQWGTRNSTERTSKLFYQEQRSCEFHLELCSRPQPFLQALHSTFRCGF